MKLSHILKNRLFCYKNKYKKMVSKLWKKNENNICQITFHSNNYLHLLYSTTGDPFCIYRKMKKNRNLYCSLFWFLLLISVTRKVSEWAVWAKCVDIRYSRFNTLGTLFILVTSLRTIWQRILYHMRSKRLSAYLLE